MFARIPHRIVTDSNSSLISHLFEKELDQPFQKQSQSEQKIAPATDVLENQEEYTILIDLPGISKEDIDLEFKEKSLTIHGTRHKPENLLKNPGKEELSGHQTVKSSCNERWEGSFHRVFQLPNNVLAEKITATLKNGILTLKLPKNELKKTKIEIS